MGNIIECFDCTGTPMSNLQCDKCSVPHFVCNLVWQWQELQLQQRWFSWWWLLYSLQSSGTSEGKHQLTMIVCHQKSVVAQKLKSRILDKLYITQVQPSDMIQPEHLLHSYMYMCRSLLDCSCNNAFIPAVTSVCGSLS